MRPDPTFYDNRCAEVEEARDDANAGVILPVNREPMESDTVSSRGCAHFAGEHDLSGRPPAGWRPTMTNALRQTTPRQLRLGLPRSNAAKGLRTRRFCANSD